jgi:two-component system, OmpR family, response regulator
VATVGLCEDEPALRSVLSRSLRRMGHEPIAVATAGEALRAFRATPPELLVLDVGLPDGDGRDLCVALRAAGVDAPVLFLTARDGVHDKVAGFEAGGDDYLTKPFDLEELRVRLEALHRRRVASTPRADDRPFLDSSRHSLVLGEQEVGLTPTEFRILGRLMAEPGHVVRRSVLVAAAWPLGGQVSDNTLDSYVRRIRLRLAEVGGGRITTQRGVGYRWQ